MFKKIIILFVLVMIVSGISVIIFWQSPDRSGLEKEVSQRLAAHNDFNNYDNTVLSLNGLKVTAYISDTVAKKEKGLSGVKYLKPNEGMLFTFSEYSQYGFWMKNMNFPIDILWLDENNNILDIDEKIFPESYPTVYRSDIPVIKVLEVPAGFVYQNQIKVGDKFSE